MTSELGSWGGVTPVGGKGAANPPGVTVPLTITGTDPLTTPLSVIAAAGQSVDMLDVSDSTQSFGVFVGSKGTLSVAIDDAPPGYLFRITSFHSNDTTMILDSTGAVTFEQDPGATTDSLTVKAPGGASTAARVTAAGAYVTHANAAPADGALSAGEVAIWFDDTNGASAVNFKGKSANGSVVTATVPLA